jgi:hypothetical protein
MIRARLGGEVSPGADHLPLMVHCPRTESASSPPTFIYIPHASLSRPPKLSVINSIHRRTRSLTATEFGFPQCPQASYAHGESNFRLTGCS